MVGRERFVFMHLNSGVYINCPKRITFVRIYCIPVLLVKIIFEVRDNVGRCFGCGVSFI